MGRTQSSHFIMTASRKEFVYCSNTIRDEKARMQTVRQKSVIVIVCAKKEVHAKRAYSISTGFQIPRKTFKTTTGRLWPIVCTQ
jgi:hypothetical protein